MSDPKERPRQRAWNVADLALAMDQQVEHRQAEPLKPGSPCPKCGVGRLDYDGLLNLVCDRCDFQQGGCFT